MYKYLFALAIILTVISQAQATQKYVGANPNMQEAQKAIDAAESKVDADTRKLVESYAQMLRVEIGTAREVADKNRVDLASNFMGSVDTLKEQVKSLQGTVATQKDQINLLTGHIKNILETIKTNKDLAKELATKEKIAVRN